MNVKTKSVLAALVDIVAVVAAPPMASAGSGGKHHQQFLLNSPEGSTTTTIAAAAGVFDGVSEDIVVDESFEESRNGRFTFTSEDEFVFDEGMLFVSIAGRGRQSFDEESCAGSGSGRATYDITGGTGRPLRRGRRQGKATFDFAFAGDKDANDNGIADPPNGVFFAKLTGTLTL